MLIEAPYAHPREGQGGGTAGLQGLRAAHLSLELCAELDEAPEWALDSAGTKDARQSGNLCVWRGPLRSLPVPTAQAEPAVPCLCGWPSVHVAPLLPRPRASSPGVAARPASSAAGGLVAARAAVLLVLLPQQVQFKARQRAPLQRQTRAGCTPPPRLQAPSSSSSLPGLPGFFL